MNTPHTPGPWNISKLATPDYAPEFAVYSDTTCTNLARIVNDNSEANARLIASAPDLLESLVEMLEEARLAGIDTMPGDDFAGFMIACENARTAISKATNP